MSDEVKAYMESIGWEQHSTCWSLRSDPELRTTMSNKAAIAVYNATRKAKVEVLEAVKRDVIGEDEDTTITNEHGEAAYYQGIGIALGRQGLRTEQRQAIDRLIKGGQNQ